MVQFSPGVLQPGQGAGLGLYSEHNTQFFWLLLRYSPVYHSSAVTKQIAELHGGTVTVTSEGEGEGSTFTVRLPGLLPVEEELHVAANTILGGENPAPVTLRLSFGNGGHPPLPPPTLVDSLLVESPRIVEDSGHPTGPSSEILAEKKVRFYFLEYVEDGSSNGMSLCQGLHTLVVDDSSMSRKMVCKALQSSKQCICEQAADGAIAVDMIRQRMAGTI